VVIVAHAFRGGGGMMDARQAAAALRGKVAGRNKITCPGPGHSPHDQSLLVSLDPNAPEGFAVHSFAGDDWRECRDYVRNRLGLPGWKPGGDLGRPAPAPRINATEEDMGPRPRTEDDAVRIKLALDVWNGGTDPRGTLAERYLTEHRRLKLTDELAGAVLRFHPRCPWRDDNKTIRVPAMVAAFRSIDDDEITAVHRIRLNPDTADKIERRMLGIVQRAAVKLSPIGDILAIGEGIETCMAAEMMGLAPAWALGSVSAITFFPVLDAVKELRIMRETGPESTKAIRFGGRRWRRAGRRVQIISPTFGSDLNDALIHELKREQLQ
jgi:putative DNA primase/helicase